ncbi:MAG: hypothetical protein ABI853_02285 [Sphingomicrobium sp.]
MGWWFGRKSAPADARPFLPAWLTNTAEEEGFARSVEGMASYVKSTGVWVNYRAGAWELGTLRATSLVLGGSQVVGARLSAIAGPSGGTNVDVESRATINQVLAALRQHGLIES